MIGDNGTGADSNAPYEDVIHECYLYNRALSASDIRWLFVEPFAFLLAQSPSVKYFLPAAAAAADGGGPRTFAAFVPGFP